MQSNVFDINTKWIWKAGGAYKDEYAEFCAEFNTNGNSDVFLKVSFDGTYCVFLNDKIVAFSRCSDYPHYKFYDLINL